MLTSLLKWIQNLLFKNRAVPYQAELQPENYQGTAYQSDLRNYQPTFFGGTIRDITGYTEEEFREGKITWDRVVHPEDLHLFLLEDEKFKGKEKHMFDLEYRIVHRDGEIRWIRDIGQVLPTPAEENPQISGALYDITRQRSRMDSLRHALGISREDFLDET